MSWVDQIHKKQRANRQAKAILNSDAYKERMEQMREEDLNRALDVFLLVTSKYLVNNFRCGQTGVLKFIDFAIDEIHKSEKDPEHFKRTNEEMISTIGVDLLKNLKFKRKPKPAKTQN